MVARTSTWQVWMRDADKAERLANGAMRQKDKRRKRGGLQSDRRQKRRRRTTPGEVS